jgi:hypothetical protein
MLNRIKGIPIFIGMLQKAETINAAKSATQRKLNSSNLAGNTIILQK